MRGNTFKVVHPCKEWCQRWGKICGLSKVDAVVQHLDHETRRIVWAITVRYEDHGKKESCLLHPGEVAEVMGYNLRYLRAVFDESARLIVTNRE